ncbi:hypothetical protein [uncultured Alistipes sp.]|uniref:lipopolysaccharide biosynthesis protein n=1 Tax=uncultured Alistipes sp. TaxID=538949 RepID=UPI0032B24195
MPSPGNIARTLKDSAVMRSFFITVFGSGLSKLILILSTFYCTHILSESEFGEFSFIRNTLNMVLCICALNFSSLCTKFTVDAKTSGESAFKLIILFLFSLFVCVVLGLVLLFLPKQLLFLIFKSDTVVFYFRIIGLLLPLFILQPLTEGVLRGMMRFKLIGLLQTLSSLLFFGAIVAGARTAGYNGAVIGMLSYYALYAAVSVLFILKPIRSRRGAETLPGLLANRSVVREMILPIFIMSFIEAPMFWLVQLLLIHFGDMTAIGGMTVITQVRNLAILIPSYFFSTYLAYASRLNAGREYDTYFNQFRRLRLCFIAAGGAVALLLTLTATPLLKLYGAAYVSNSTQLVIANLGIPFLLLSGLLRIELIIQEHQKELLYISVAWNLLWVAVLIPMLLLGVHSLTAFFTSQLLAIVFQYLLIHLIYQKDRKRLLRPHEDSDSTDR